MFALSRDTRRAFTSPPPKRLTTHKLVINSNKTILTESQPPKTTRSSWRVYEKVSHSKSYANLMHREIDEDDATAKMTKL